VTPAKVSVIVPVFNGERYLGEALDSLKCEQAPQLEIIVVDDGSTDGSTRIVEALARHDPRISLIASEHGGVSAARNIGVRAASAAYITFLDSDDICPPGRIARQLRKLTSNPEAAAIIGETIWFEALTADLEPVPGTRHARVLCVHLHSALFARSTFDNYGLFDETLEQSEDLDFFLRLAEANAVLLFEDEVASLYRRHDGNLTLNLHDLRKQMLAALHRSIARRRAAGRNGSLDAFFTRKFSFEVAFDSGATADDPSVSSADRA
jgi:glycosyltransferase involved in cell wall biosynthesis